MHTQPNICFNLKTAEKLSRKAIVAKWNAESNCGKSDLAIITKSIGNEKYTEPPKGSGLIWSDYKGYKKYPDYETAIREFCRQTRIYTDKQGLKTLDKITNQWTPPSENKTSQHLNDIVSAMRKIYARQYYASKAR
jgi:hypothetical protein